MPIVESPRAFVGAPREPKGTQPGTRFVSPPTSVPRMGPRSRMGVKPLRAPAVPGPPAPNSTASVHFQEVVTEHQATEHQACAPAVEEPGMAAVEEPGMGTLGPGLLGTETLWERIHGLRKEHAQRSRDPVLGAQSFMRTMRMSSTFPAPMPWSALREEEVFQACRAPTKLSRLGRGSKSHERFDQC